MLGFGLEFPFRVNRNYRNRGIHMFFVSAPHSRSWYTMSVCAM